MSRQLATGLLGVFWLATARLPGSPPPVTVADEVLADAQGAAQVEVALSSAGQSVAAIQFDIQYPDQVLVVTVSVGPAAVGAGKAIATSQLQPARQRVLIVGLNQNPIADGVVATLLVQKKADAPPGPCSLSIEDVVLASPEGNAVFAQGSEGGVIVVGGADYVPDGYRRGERSQQPAAAGGTRGDGRGLGKLAGRGGHEHYALFGRRTGFHHLSHDQMRVLNFPHWRARASGT